MLEIPEEVLEIKWDNMTEEQRCDTLKCKTSLRSKRWKYLPEQLKEAFNKCYVLSLSETQKRKLNRKKLCV